MLPPLPPEWEYSRHPDRGRILLLRTEEVLQDIESGIIVVDSFLSDTRDVHRRMFTELITPGVPAHFAGSYRGEALLHLETYNVMIPGNPVVGVDAGQVSTALVALERQRHQAFSVIDHAVVGGILADATRLVAVTRVAARIFSNFLVIHPYVNGNGHIARMMLAAIMFRYGFRLRGFPVEPSPTGLVSQEYDHALMTAQLTGDFQPLETFILRRYMLPPP